MSNIINFGGRATNILTPFKPEGKSYLTFSSPNSFTLAVGDATKHWDGALEYFDSNKTWTTWDGTPRHCEGEARGNPRRMFSDGLG